MRFPGGIFNVFIIGPMALSERELHTRSWWERQRSRGDLEPQQHTIVLKQAIEGILRGERARELLGSADFRVEIPDEGQGADIMRDVFSKIDTADLVVAD